MRIKLVGQHGIDPWSFDYQSNALPLSYRPIYLNLIMYYTYLSLIHFVLQNWWNHRDLNPDHDIKSIVV